MFTMGIIAVLAMFVAMEGGLLLDWGTWLTNLFELPTTKFHWLIAGSYVLLAGAVLFALYFLCCALAAGMLRISMKQALIASGYIYLPFAYLMFIRDIFVVYFVDGSMIQVWLGSGPQWLMLIVPGVEIFLIFIAAAWSLFLAYRVTQIIWFHENTNKQPEWQEILAGAAPHMLLVFALAWHWTVLLGSEQLQPFLTLGISPWVPYAVPLLCIVLFFIAHKTKLLSPLEWELENP
jgi:hypothetical protein